MNKPPPCSHVWRWKAPAYEHGRISERRERVACERCKLVEEREIVKEEAK